MNTLMLTGQARSVARKANTTSSALVVDPLTSDVPRAYRRSPTCVVAIEQHGRPPRRAGGGPGCAGAAGIAGPSDRPGHRRQPAAYRHGRRQPHLELSPGPAQPAVARRQWCHRRARRQWPPGRLRPAQRAGGGAAGAVRGRRAGVLDPCAAVARRPGADAGRAGALALRQ
ncbi:hypothetical protein G6F32_014578 [Rhizopus arrhizus]|nr:hypothetical protein G6F32_014578 [Rhizopus arrhizus]